MAAQVPYDPSPKVAPSNQAIAAPRVDAPAAAFGGEVAQAVSGLGRAMESSANELFGRAVAIQTLNNQTEAAEAETKFMIEAGQLHANYNSLQGKDRVDAFPKHQEELEKIRAKIGEGLSNDMSRKLYTTQSRSTLGRTMFSAAGAAATANRQWTGDVVKNQLQLDIKTIEDNPTDEALFQDKLRRITQGAKNIAAQEGAPPGSSTEQQAILAAQSKAWAQRLVGLSRTRPFDAQTLLEKNKGFMTSDDFLKTETSVKTQVRAVGSANIANEVWAGGQETAGSPAKSLADMEAEAEKKAKNIDPNDPILANQAIAGIRNKFNQNKYATQTEQASNEQIVYDAIQKGAKSEQELLADPKVAAAYEALPSKSSLKKSPLNYTVKAFNTRKDQDEQVSNYQTLRGKAISDPVEFLNTNLQNTNLNDAQRTELLKTREQVIKRQGGDVRVFGAMNILRGAYGGQMRALKVYNSSDDKESFDRFTGALSIALDDYVAQNKKPADANTILKEIGPNLMKSVTEEGRAWGIFGNRQTPFFQPGTHTAEYGKFETQYQAALPQATPEQTYKAYQRYLYQKFYGKKTTE